MNVLDIKDVSKSFGNHLVLNDISLQIPKNKIFGLLGPNGAGKTTLIRIINQIITLDKGQILFNGKPIKREFVEKMGYLPEERGLYPKMKVGEHMLYLAALKGMTGAKARETIKKYLKEFDLYDWWYKKVEQLSKGMQQKLQFIISIMHDPDFVILDEPFTGFDPLNVELVKSRIKELKEQGTTFMLSTHRMDSVEELCDYVTLINKANKVLDGNKNEIRQTYSKNIFEIIYDGAESRDIPGRNQFWNSFENKGLDEQGRTTIRFMLDQHVRVNEVMPLWLQYGDIYSVNEIIPSMNDIFISLVNTQADEQV
ncbi:MAG: ATP-binding cassette domain-containing protein [Bacteroidetes bacterium]|nr:ABC transporter ATP-binding protein [Bacteroidota bacterium]MBL6963328.1 ATP-binding cassette domain-containing protein [Bacteroidota bacterium]